MKNFDSDVIRLQIVYKQIWKIFQNGEKKNCISFSVKAIVKINF